MDLRNIQLMLMETVFNLLDGMEQEDLTGQVVEYEIMQLHDVRNVRVALVDFENINCRILFSVDDEQKYLSFSVQ